MQLCVAVRTGHTSLPSSLQPSLGHGVRNRLQLLNLLREHEKEGLGGIKMADVVESIPNAERAIQVTDKVMSVVLKE